MKTAEINAALDLLLTAYDVSFEKFAVIYKTDAAAVRVTYSEKTGWYRVANAEDNSGGYTHGNPVNVAGAIARRIA